MRESLGRRWVKGCLLIISTYILFLFAFAPCWLCEIASRDAPEEAGAIRALLYTLAAAYGLVVSPLAFYWAARKAGSTLQETGLR